MDRDFVGYGPDPQVPVWPNGARLAISVAVNYEEGAEYSLQDGSRRELMGEVPSPVPADQRDLMNESMFEYGSRVGVWRLLRILEKHSVPATFFLCGQAVERNPSVGRAVVAAGHEPCGHGYRWEESHLMTREEELAQIRRTTVTIERMTGVRPQGWFVRLSPSLNTRELIALEAGFVYDSNAVNDDIPYYVKVQGTPWLVIPYSIELNDTRFWRGGLNSIADFEQYLIDAFDCLYEEGKSVPKMMSFGLHCRISGTPARSRAVDRFLGYAGSHPDVWFARRLDIANWWRKHSPPPSD